MSHRKEILEETVSAIRSEFVTEETEAEAGRRVWERLSLPATDAREGEGALALIEGCDGFQRLIPDYLSGRLSEARRALLEDHTSSCVPCRRALRAAREGRSHSEMTAPVAAPRSKATAGRWAIAASVAGVGLVSWLWMEGFLSPPDPQLAQVRAVEGQLLLVEKDGMRPLGPGDWVAEGDSVRTAKASTAVLRLEDGSLIEIGERSQLAIANRRRQTTVRVRRGGIIVQAADQRSGELSVATDELLASVRGTIFAVSHGVKGSHVAVVEGEVQVESGRQERLLFPGEQFSSNARLGPVSFSSAIEWSQDSDRYFELLRDLSELRRDLATVSLAADLRYESRFVDVVAEDTVVYASLPNLGASMQQVKAIVSDRLATSETLREWWEQNLSAASGDAERILQLLETVADELGDEVVIAVGGDLEGDVAPLALAELHNPSTFEETLLAALEEIATEEDGNFSIGFIVDPREDEGGDNELLLWIDGDVLAVSSEIRVLRRLRRELRRGSAFVGSDFHGALSQAYAGGTEVMVGVDVASLIAGVDFEGADSGGSGEEAAVLEWSGIQDVRHLIVDSRTVDNLSETAAELSFSSERRGVMAWLAAPAPMGSLDFVSAEASAASAFVLKDPIDIVGEVFGLIANLDPKAMDQLAEVEQTFGIDLRNDLAAPLGGEVSVSIDGPILPTPSWKMVVEVYDPRRLQSTTESLVARFGDLVAEEADGHSASLELTSEDRGGRMYYRIVGSGSLGDGDEITDVEESLEAHYSYYEGYLIAAPTLALVDRAIQTRESQFGFLESASVQALMPSDGIRNVSGLVYQDVGSALQPLLNTLSQVVGRLRKEQQGLVKEFAEEILTSSLLTFYGENEAIRLVATMEGEILGGALSRMLGAGQLLGLSGILQESEDVSP